MNSSLTQAFFKHAYFHRVFAVPKKDGSLRPVSNLKPLNEFVRNPKIKMTDASHIAAAMSPDCWFTGEDLSSAYHHVMIHPSSRRFFLYVVEGTPLLFSSYAVWTSSSCLHLHETRACGYSRYPLPGHYSHRLSRRWHHHHTFLLSKYIAGKTRSVSREPFVASLGLPHKYGEDSDNTISGVELFGLYF